MKNLLKAAIAALILFVAAPVALHAQAKATPAAVAHFDLDSLLNVMPDFKKASEDAAAYYKMLEGQLVQMQNQLDLKMNEYDSLNKTWSPLIKGLKEKEIVDLQQNMQTFQVSAQTEFSNKRADLLKPIYEKIRNAAKAVAARRGYKYVIDSSKSSAIVIYASPADDIFMDMLKELGITLPAPTTPAPGGTAPAGGGK
ncbi:MAG: OmpH family outer membrane protein [Bacteroidetes bacterium]|nr:OmpH family outer membrane protein [Bacteroidota bacterium]